MLTLEPKRRLLKQLIVEDAAEAKKTLKLKGNQTSSCANQAEEIFEKLCESVATSLEAKKLASFTRISSTVQGLDDDAALQVMKLYEELVELWPDGATIELNALYVEQKIGRGHCTAGIRSDEGLTGCLKACRLPVEDAF